jgi:hypothetical protein
VEIVLVVDALQMEHLDHLKTERHQRMQCTKSNGRTLIFTNWNTSSKPGS